MMLSHRRRRLLCTVLFVGLPPLMFAGAWRLGGVSALEDDVLYYLPIRAFIGDAIRHGEWPLWNPYVSLGSSIAADPQAGLWYPATLLFAVLPPFVAYSIVLCLHYSLAGAGMYRFLRAAGRVPLAALVGGIAFMFCGFLVGHRAHLTIVQAAAWLPWMLYAWERYARSARGEFAALGAAALGLQLLVQHVQISIISVALVTAYAAFVLWRRRRSLAWAFPAATAAGVLIGGVQLLPTLAAVGRSARGAPAYYLFIENSYMPSSLYLWLFPFFFGTRTPNVYSQPWWGLSHLCEQSTYASVAVLVLALAALCLWKREGAVRFWAMTAAASLVLALGRFTPLSTLLFDMPLYNSLRVPARWVLAFDVAMIALAAAAVDALVRAGPASAAVRRWLGATATRGVPIAAGILIATMIVGRLAANSLLPPALADGAREAVRATNPAILAPLVLIAATAVLLGRMARAGGPPRARVLLPLLLVDLASFAAFVDVDVSTYADCESLVRPPLAQALTADDGGDRDGRLWVPRIDADYRRPVEVLWPQTNLWARVPTLNGYGPLGPVEQRLLLRFMPWGANQDALGLLLRPDLLGALGVRWLAARTDAERELIATAEMLSSDTELTPVPGAPSSFAVDAAHEMKLPVDASEPGVYVAELTAAAGTPNRNRWYLRLEDAEGHARGALRWYDPSDFAAGERTLRVYLRCREPTEQPVLRAWAEAGARVTIRDVRFGRAKPVEPGTPARYRRVAELPDGVIVYELPTWRGRFAWADSIATATDVLDAVARLRGDAGPALSPSHAVIEAAEAPPHWPGTATITVTHERLNAIALTVQSDAPGLVVFNDTFDPGWRAWVSGRPAQSYRADAVVQAVAVGPGSLVVVWRYWPIGLTGGIIASVVGLATTAGLGAVNRAGRATVPGSIAYKSGSEPPQWVDDRA